jgi:hypothetical protein
MAIKMQSAEMKPVIDKPTKRKTSGAENETARVDDTTARSVGGHPATMEWTVDGDDVLTFPAKRLK